MITNEHKLTKISFHLMKILLGIVFVLEIDRFISAFQLSNFDFDIWNRIAFTLIFISVATLFVLIMLGNKRVPVLWFVLFVFKVLSFFSATNFYLSGWRYYDGLPAIMVVAYYVTPILLTLVDIIYSVSLTLQSKSERIAASKKGKDFGEFLKVENQASKS